MGLHEQRAILARGDPGLWGALKGAVKGFVTGGPLGAIRGGITGALRKPEVVSPTPVPPAPGYLPRLGLPGSVPGLQHPMAGPLIRGAAPMQLAVGVGGPQIACPSGFHPNKSSYMTLQGFVPKWSKCVKNRRRNVSNGPANARALRRITAWDKMDRKRRTTLKRIAR